MFSLFNFLCIFPAVGQLSDPICPYVRTPRWQCVRLVGVIGWQVWHYVRVYMLESLLDVYGHHMDNDWNNLVTRGFDEAQEKVGDGCLFPADILEHNAIIMLMIDTRLA